MKVWGVIEAEMEAKIILAMDGGGGYGFYDIPASKFF